MNFIMRNVAKVSEANVALEGVTVVAGGNSTGKSTISRALVTLSNLSTRLVDLIREERVNSMVRAISNEFVRRGEQVFFRPGAGGGFYQAFDPLLSVEFWADSGKLAAWLAEQELQGTGIGVYRKEFLVSEEFQQVHSLIRMSALEIIGQSDDVYIRYILGERMPNAFASAMFHVDGDGGDPSFELLNSAFQVRVCFKGEKVDTHSGLGAKPFSSLFYSEPEHRLDSFNRTRPPFFRVFDRYSAGRSLSASILNDPPPSDSMEDKEEYEQTMAFVRKLSEVLHGRLIRDNRGLGFSESFPKGDFRIQLNNMASGMKTMATIMRLLENKTLLPGGLLAIDEPESNLHPAWQVEFAYWLVHLSKERNIRLLLNSHSPYFIRAVEKCTDDLKMGDATHFYSMVPDLADEGDSDDAVERSYRTEQKDGRLEDIYNDLACPLEDVL